MDSDMTGTRQSRSQIGPTGANAFGRIVPGWILSPLYNSIPSILPLTAMSWQNEKLSLPGATQNVGQKRGAQRGIRLLRLVLFAALAWSFASSLDVFILEDLGLWFDIDLPQSFQHTLEPSCAQVPALTPERNGPLWNAVGEEISGDAYKTRAINWLSGAVQVP